MNYKTFTFIFPRALTEQEEKIFIGCMKAKSEDVKAWFDERIKRLEEGKQGKVLDQAGQGVRQAKENTLSYLKLAYMDIRLNKIEDKKYRFAILEVPEFLKNNFKLDINLRTDDVIIRTGFSLGDVAIKYSNEEII
jgi:hypothetical protein